MIAYVIELKSAVDNWLNLAGLPHFKDATHHIADVAPITLEVQQVT